MKYLLSIPRVPPSANAFLRMHWRERARLTDEWRRDVGYLLIENPAPAFEIARLTAEIFFPTRRRRDILNYATPLDKLAIDAIVAAGVLVDDDSVHLPEVTIRFAIDKKSPRTELTLTAI